MIQRIRALERIVSHAAEDACVISPLGYISRDLYSLTPSMRQRCFYCMGSMGSVIPVALGVSRANPGRRIIAIEGDGSLLMNLGGLVTLRRYGRGNILAIIFDNGLYESSGGQISQPPGFAIEDVCASVGLPTTVARREEELDEFLVRREREDAGIALLVVKVALAPPAARIDDDLDRISGRFSRWLRGVPEEIADEGEMRMIAAGQEL